MSEATQRVRDFLTKSPSVVYPDDVLGLFEQVERENAELRNLVRALDWCTENADLIGKCDQCPLQQSDELTPECEVRMRELGVEAEE